MSHPKSVRVTRLLGLAGLLMLAGCLHPCEYVRNGFKVGPNYRPPSACVAQQWLDAADRRVRDDRQVPCYWWGVFNDPILSGLVGDAANQNLTLRQAGFRVLQARDQLCITTGNVFPQQQDVFGSYRRQAAAGNYFDQWTVGASLSWELDFWGRFRRAIKAGEAQVDASVAEYDDAMVTMLADLAANYVILRTNQERIRLLEQNIAIQQSVLDVAEERLVAERLTSVDVEQVRSNLLQSQSAVEALRIELRQASDRLCVLLGVTPVDLAACLPAAPIPVAPAEIAVGMPAELLCRRPDIRRAERLVAAQSEEVGIAIAELYPAISVNGTLGYQARNFSDLFRSQSFQGNVGPSFQWNVLQYGRLVGNIRLQDDRLQELIVAYQAQVLQANAEAEDGLVQFLQSQRRAKLLEASAAAAAKAVLVIREQLNVAKIDFNQYAVIQQSLITQQDQWAQARGQIALGLIQVYRAVGGGWELRTCPLPPLAPAAAQPTPAEPAAAPERLPPPQPELGEPI